MANVQKTLKALRAYLAAEHAKNPGGVTNPDVWVSSRFMDWMIRNAFKFNCKCVKVQHPTAGAYYIGARLSFPEIMPAFLSLTPTHNVGAYPTDSIIAQIKLDNGYVVGAEIRRVQEQEGEGGFVVATQDFWRDVDFWDVVRYIADRHADLKLYVFNDSSLIFLPVYHGADVDIRMRFNV